MILHIFEGLKNQNYALKYDCAYFELNTSQFCHECTHTQKRSITRENIICCQFIFARKRPDGRLISASKYIFSQCSVYHLYYCCYHPLPTKTCLIDHDAVKLDDSASSPSFIITRNFQVILIHINYKNNLNNS